MSALRQGNGRLDKLPDELLDLIFDFCSIDSLKDLRLTNKHLARIATPLAFAHHHLGLFASSIERLLNLSRSPYAKYVRKLSLHSDVLPDWSRETWEQHIDQRPPFTEWLEQAGPLYRKQNRHYALQEYQMVPMHHLTPRELANGFATFQSMRQEQIACKATLHGLVLKECLSGLPNLDEVIVGKAKPFSGLVNNAPFWKPLLEQILVSPNTWFYDRPRPNVPIELEGMGALLLLEAVGYRASFSGIKHVQKMKLDMTFNYSFQSTMVFNHGEAANGTLSFSSRFESLKEVLKPVMNLEILAPFASDAWPRDSVDQAAEIHELLLAARGLRVLDLSYGDAEKKEYNDYREQFGLLPLFSSTTAIWPHITSLSLTASVPGQAFANFLSLHAGTLKKLDMRDNVSDDWRVVLECIPRKLKLETIYLECLWQWYSDEETMENGIYLCFFAEGTDEDNEDNKALQSFLLHGEGELKLPLPDFANDDVSDGSVYSDIRDTTDEYDVAAW